YFSTEMNRQRGYFSPKEFERRLQLGQFHLGNFYEINKSSWPAKTQAEFKGKNVEWQCVPLTGVIDRIDFEDGHIVRIIDYKTGSTDHKKVSRPTESNPLGGTYWRQLVFYKILYEQQQGQHVVKEAEIAYLEADNRDRY